MADDERRRRNQEDANDGNSDDNMDVDDIDLMDSDDEEFQMAADDIEAVPLPFRIGPHRAQSHDRIPEFLLNDRLGRFIQNYRVMSARHLENRGHANLESGGKVILPQDALEILSRNSSALMRPMMFKATNQNKRKFTHCGVLEFIAEERTCYMPTWMMDFLEVSDRDMIQIERVELPTATFAKFQAQSVDFLEIADQRAVLENTLRHFSCLTKDDMIAIHYNNRIYKLCVLETLPKDAVTIIECDMNVDFAAPVGYVSPSESDAEDADSTTGNSASFSAFKGTGNRLNGKAVDPPGTSAKGTGTKKIVPDHDWVIGTLEFKRKFRKLTKAKSGTSRFTAFGGAGLSLRNTKKSSTNDDFS